MTSAKDTFIASVNTATTNLYSAGEAGNSGGTLIPNNTQDFPSVAAIEAAYAAGAIKLAQREALRNQAIMHAQTKVQTAKDVLRAAGESL